MKGIRLYTTWNQVLFKVVSNAISMKTWLTVLATVLLFEGLLGETSWMVLVAGLYGVREVNKVLVARLSSQEEEPE